MFQGPNKIQDFVRQASSLNMVTTAYSIGLSILLVFFMQLEGRNDISDFYLNGAISVILVAFFVKFMMQFTSGLRGVIKEEEFELIVALLNTLSTFFAAKAISLISINSSSYIDLFHAFIPTLLFILITPLTWRKKHKAYVGIFGFFEWVILLSVAIWVCTIVTTIINNEQWALLFTNVIIFLSPFVIKTLGQRHVDLLTERMHKEIYVDPLTKVFNRKCFYDAYDKIREKNKNKNMKSDGLAIFFIDIDHFKKYNDYYGHDKGDDCLFNVSSFLQKLADELNLTLYRIGGEEFLMCGEVFHIDWESIMVNSKIKRWIDGGLSLPHEHIKAPSGKVTLSGGLAFIKKEEIYSLNAVGVSKSADVCLFKAKETGRGKLVVEGVNK